MKKWTFKIFIAISMVYAVGAILSLMNVTKFDLFSTNAISKNKDASAVVFETGVGAAVSSNKAEVPLSTCGTSDCHADEVKAFERTSHSKSKTMANNDATKLCGSCHAGDLAEHADANSDKSVKIPKMAKYASTELNNQCLSCHKNDEHRFDATLSTHTSAGVSCISCHDSHPSAEHSAKMMAGGTSNMQKNTNNELCLSCHKSEDAQFSQTTHHRLKEGVMDCNSCHNPHGSSNAKMLTADKKEVCVKCHEDKRGPFMFEHAAILNDQGCVACHEQHGGGGQHLLKARDAKSLCMSCHSKEAIGMHGVSGIQYNNGIPVAGLTSAGDCTRCHEEIHGSNINPFFHR